MTRRSARLCGVLAMIALVAAPSSAITWVGAGTAGNTATDPSDSTTQWNVKSNWNPSHIPVDADSTILIPLSNGGCVYAPQGVFSLAVTVTVNGTSDNGCFCIGNGSSFQPITGFDTLTVGNTAKGRVLQTGGSLTITSSNRLNVGRQSGSTGTYDLENGTVSSYEIDLGYYSGHAGGTGSFLQRNGAVTATTVMLGGSSGYAGKGTYELDNGTLNAGTITVGGSASTASGTFTQTGGACAAAITVTSHGTYTVQNGSVVGSVAFTGGTFHQISGTVDSSSNAMTVGSSSLYQMDNGTLAVKSLTVNGAATFRQNGGTNTVSQGFNVNGGATYQMGGGALNTLGGVILGTSTGSTVGHFVQTGGVHTTQSLSIGYTGGTGTYDLSGGSLSMTSAMYPDVIAYGSTFHQSGGTVNCVTTLGLNGTYTLDNGTLAPNALTIAYAPQTASFVQNGGTNQVPTRLSVGYSYNSGTGYGSYQLNQGAIIVGPAGSTSGMLAVGDYQGRGTLTQTAGSVTVNGSLLVGYFTGTGTYNLSGGTVRVSRYTDVGDSYGSATGTLNISGGSLVTKILEISPSTTAGTLSLTSAAGYVGVTGTFLLGDPATFNAVSGASVHMLGGSFQNTSLHPSKLAGLGNLSLIFDGGPAFISTCETAGLDFGRSLAGFNLNFHLGTLAVGGTDNIGILQLVDGSNNGNRGGVGGASEALYVSRLLLGAGASLDLNGLHLYVGSIQDNGATVTNGQIISMLPGDANGDFKVDGADLAVWQKNFDPMGLDNNTFASGDWNGDGKVDGSDLAIWQLNFNPAGSYNPSFASGPLSSVPEPATAVLLASAAAILPLRRVASGPRKT